MAAEPSPVLTDTEKAETSQPHALLASVTWCKILEKKKYKQKTVAAFERVSHYVAQAGLECMILLPQPPQW